MDKSLNGNFDEHALLEQMQRGDVEAFERIFKSYYPHLVLFAQRYLHDKDQSESIVQDIFVQLWEKRGEQEIKSLKGFLVVSVRNRCQNELKHNKVVRAYQKNEASKHPAEWPEYKDRFYIDKINEAIDKLPPQCKRIFKMSRLEGLKYYEIANKLDISPKTVEAQMGKALKFLREALHPLKQQLLNTFYN